MSILVACWRYPEARDYARSMDLGPSQWGFLDREDRLRGLGQGSEVHFLPSAEAHPQFHGLLARAKERATRGLKIVFVDAEDWP